MGEDRSIEALRQSYLQFVGGEFGLTYASFHGWFGASLTAFFREVLDYALEDLGRSSDRLNGRLDRFRDVLVPDTTVVTLYQSLTETFPGYGDDHAGAKFHIVESVSTGLPMQFSITDACTHESTQLSTGQWLSGSLLLYDQGFFGYHTMDLIDANDGWFVTRLKPNANPWIVEELRDWRGNAISLTGKQLHAVLDDLHRVFSRYGGLILRRIAQYLGYDPPKEHLLELLLAAAIDPNPHRSSLIEDVQHGAFVRELA